MARPTPHFLGAHLAWPTVMLARHPQKLLRDDIKKCSSRKPSRAGRPGASGEAEVLLLQAGLATLHC